MEKQIDINWEQRRYEVAKKVMENALEYGLKTETSR